MKSKKRVSKHPSPSTHMDNSSPSISKTDEKDDRQIKALIESVKDRATREIILSVQQNMEKSFSGPLPPPEDFEKYNQILPNAAERILSMAEKEQQIRAAGQEGMLANDDKRINRATWVAMGLIVVAGVATWKGFAIIAIPLGLAGVISSGIRLLNQWLQRKTE